MSELVTDQKIDWKSLPHYDDVQVKQLLAVLPNSMWKAGQARDQAEVKRDSLKHDLRVSLAKSHLLARNDPTLTSNDDRKAWAITQPEVMALETSIIEADGDLAAKRLNYDRLENWFTAVRKIASMMIDLDKASNNTSKYNHNESQR